MTQPADEKNQCGGTTKAGTPCKNGRGWKTDHPGVGKCKHHGGNVKGAKVGNKYALRTGEYETITYSALSDEEKQLWDSVGVDPRKQCEDDLKLVCIRIHRMLILVSRYQEAASKNEGMLVSGATHEEGFSKNKVDLTTVEYSAADDSILRLEEAITRTSVLKVRIIEQLRGILKENPPESGGLDAIVNAIDRSAALIANRQQLNNDLDHAVGDL